MSVTKDVIVRHIHNYKLSPSRPADTMTLADDDAAGFWNEGESLSDQADNFSDTVIKVSADPETGEMFAYWTQAGEASETPYESKADFITTSHIHAYFLGASIASATEIRELLDQAEADAKSYAEEHDLEYKNDLVTLLHDGESIFATWSTESE